MRAASEETRGAILEILSIGGHTRDELASATAMTNTAIGYHLTQMRKKGQIESKKGKWQAVKKKVPTIAPAVEPVLVDAEPEPSLMILLVAARTAMDEAIHRLEEVEAKMLGGFR
jgi:DNA-binding transcriptional ArsR family regulator